MTDAEKIKWFDDTMEWMSQWADEDGGPEEAIDTCYDAAVDLFFDVVKQYRKVTK